AHILDSPGFPIGLANEPYVERSVHLAAGDRLYLYSDGLPDAMNPSGERFGDARLLQAFDRLSTEPLRAGIATVIAEIARWHGEEKHRDDISILAVELAPVSDKARARLAVPDLRRGASHPDLLRPIAGHATVHNTL